MTPRLNQSEKDAAKYQNSMKCIRKLIFKYGSKDELKEMRNQYKSNENDIVLRQAYQKIPMQEISYCVRSVLIT